jgi:hypothetical protein
MTTRTKTKAIPTQLIKQDPNSPVFEVTGRDGLSIKAGTVFEGHFFATDVPVQIPHALVAGADYGITVANGIAQAWRTKTIPVGEGVIGGFHFAPGGNASARAGGDNIPAINPFSRWDLIWRPVCPDPRGMFLIEGPEGRAWLDIYKLGRDHLEHGTSKFGVTIADGNDPPQNPAGGYFNRLDYATAAAVMAHHGKTLASVKELEAAAYGVTEHSSADRDPKITGLDAARTSRFGMNQASGNLWDWCHDGTPAKRPSIFGGSWWGDGFAGSRCANLGYWPDLSDEDFGARGRSDHLQPA